MRHERLADVNCSIARSVAVLGERWTLVILREAFTGARRFEDYLRGTEIARNILTDRLRGLVDHGILERRPAAGRSGAFEYRLTERGRDLYPVLISLLEWGDKHTGHEHGPPLALRHQACGELTTPLFVCSHCGEEIDPREVRPEVGPGANVPVES